MTDRPILFSAPMVRAILDGRKTQTRRIVKRSIINHHSLERDDSGVYWVEAEDGDHHKVTDWCPYGQPGDRLWVRENFYCDHVDYPEGCSITVRWREVDGQRVAIPTDEQRAEMRHLTYYQADGDPGFEEGGKVRWRPSIHMHRWLSRVTLEITGVRVERLNEISEADAKAEGATLDSDGFPTAERPLDDGYDNCRDWYADLWESINGPDSWDANPWVWVVEFKRVTP